MVIRPDVPGEDLTDHVSQQRALLEALTAYEVDHDEINAAFLARGAVSPVQMHRAGAISHHFAALAAIVHRLVPPSRERSLVMTKLQEAHGWATQGVIGDPAAEVLG